MKSRKHRKSTDKSDVLFSLLDTELFYLLFECLFCTEKWLINQNFKISQDKRIPEPRPALWDKMGHFQSREINLPGAGDKIFLVSQKRLFSNQRFPSQPGAGVLLLLIYCSKYSKWKTTNQHFNTCYSICHGY